VPLASGGRKGSFATAGGAALEHPTNAVAARRALTRAALVEHFKEERFVHPAAHFAPDAAKLSEWLAKNAGAEDDDDATAGANETVERAENTDVTEDQLVDEDTGAFREAAE
jgi:ParB family chromosome partitioning protein